MSDPGACAPAGLLERFVRGELDEKREQEIREHLKHCGICGLIVERLPEAMAVEAEGEVLAMDESLARRVDEGFRNHLARLSSHPRERKPKRSAFPWLHPAFAYGLVLLLMYPAYLGLSSRFGGKSPDVKREVPVQRPALAPASIINLNAERGVAPTDRPGVQAPVAGAGAQVLTFFVGVNPALGYTASLADSTGATVFDAGEIWSSDGEGTFYLVCPTRLAPGAAYKLRVAASDRVSGRVEKEYLFEFRAP
jgi:anti-sigma factor RsiW